MTYTATITSKRQLTIPAKIFKKKFKQGDKVVIRETKSGIEIESQTEIINRLAGSIKLPKEYHDLDLDQIIALGKAKHFSSKTKENV